MSGFTPGTADFNAAVAYYSDLHYQNPSLLALHGLSYYTDSPAWREFIKAGNQPVTSTTLGKYRGNATGAIYTAWDIDAESQTAPNGETVTQIEERITITNWLYDPSADLSFLHLREGESVWFTPNDGSDTYVGQWHLDTPAIQNITRGLNWSDVRAGIEYVGTALALAYVGGELLTPAADVAPEALGIGADIGVDVAANTTTGLIGTATEIAPIVADVAPVVTDIVPTVADVAPAVTDIAPTVADIAPAVPNTAPSLTELAGNVKSVVGTVTTAERLLHPLPNRSINPPTIPVSQTLSPLPNESGEIPVVALLGLLLFKVI